ncbi:MAG: response regulator [Desulfuromonadaceae bacterium]|nr:response regulator [Desulfuromonadaceae bacterium]
MSDIINNDTKLRTKAVDTLSPSAGVEYGEQDVRRLLHELQVHQVELELQNAELRKVKEEMLAEKTLNDEFLNFLEQTSSRPLDEPYFNRLAHYLAKSLDMDFVCIDRLEGDGLTARTVAVWCDGSFEDNVTYALKDTPCGNVVGKTVCCFPSRVCHLFPNDQVLQDLRAESYIGVTLWSQAHQPIGLIAVISRRPVTNRAMAESIMKIVGISAAGEIERLDAEEHQKNLEQQLVFAQKLESLGVLTGGIAHDFNNILAIIMGYCSLIRMDFETAKNYIPEMEKAVDRAAGLCRQMLTYAGKAQIVSSSFDFVDLVFEMVKMLKASLPHNSVIKLESPPNIPQMSGDASQIRQIVLNLIVNASEAIGDSQGEILVSISKIAITQQSKPALDHQGKAISPGWYTCLEVTDNGCGMSNETRQRIFEPFYTTKFTGRGLGMSAVLGIITSHGGALQLFSQSGQGTTFKIYLPIPDVESAGNNAVQEALPTPWTGHGTVLLIEDEDRLMLIAKAFLLNLGFTVIEASNGKEALELYHKNSSDISLVVTDVGMPTMNGYELFIELKKLKPELPIIISSGFGDEDISSNLFRRDIAGLISKPYRFDQFRDVLRRVVEGTELARA